MEGASGGCPYNRNGRLSLSTGGAELSGAAVRRGTVSVQRRTGQVPPPSGGDMTEFNSNDDMDIDLPPEWSTGSTQGLRPVVFCGSRRSIGKRERGLQKMVLNGCKE